MKKTKSIEYGNDNYNIIYGQITNGPIYIKLF